MVETYVHNLVAQYEWLQRGNISVAGAALTTDKSAVTTHALAATTFVRIPVDDGTIALDLRWSGGTDGDSNVQNLYAMRGDSDHYTLIATLTLTTGTQVGVNSRLLIDKIVLTAEKWVDEIVVLSLEDNDIARISLNTHGYRNFLLLGTTVNSTLYIEAARE